MYSHMISQMYINLVPTHPKFMPNNNPVPLQQSEDIYIDVLPANNPIYGLNAIQTAPTFATTNAPPHIHALKALPENNLY